jgi:hypoxanthine phosphoribosyltransferase
MPDATSVSSRPTVPQSVVCRGERFRLYLDEETIGRRVAELGRQISEDFAGKRPILIGVLNGAYMFLADLMRFVTIDCEVDFLKLSSYGAEKVSSGQVRELKRIDADIAGRHVVIVEDIVDTGLSMKYIRDLMELQHPASVQLCTLLHKKAATNPDLELDLDYVGFEIDNLFVIGYGLDYGQLARNLPAIYILDAVDNHQP